MDEINKIPPVTRTMLASLMAVTIPVLLKLISPYHFILWWPMITKKWQFWRFYTAFFFGSSGIQFLFDVFMLFRNASELEIGHFHRRTADFVRAIFVVAIVIVATNYPLSNSVLFHPLLSGLSYLWSRANPHGSVSLFGFVTIPARWVPYAYLGLDVLMAGPPQAILSATGIIGGHTYWFLEHILPESNGGRGPRYLPATPAWLRRQLPDSVDPNQRGGGGQGGGGAGAWAPRGRAFGDGGGSATTSSSGGSAANMAGRGRSLGSNSGTGSSWTSTISNWMTGTGAGGGGSAASYAAPSASGSRTSNVGGPNREEMYRAAEARLKKMREGSIAGKNEKASALAAAARAANAESAFTRRTTAGSVGSSGFARSATFAEMKAREEKESEGGNKTGSASGGRVMEERRDADDDPDDARQRAGVSSDGPADSWKGKGRTLAD
ncbi:DER1-domain-containing protein [Ceraceosorus guamensis]|uniref:Derlin n=1 Tax=Ceraceosorus guamensis TaxID=1522189 RepID=A0A316W7D4_9BASI|nr:DER1-domain-containing protein [Ceraceosorus guamensis]PWN43973.1 DER1-domain-containing protein [Ceraceosorus guamensis]